MVFLAFLSPRLAAFFRRLGVFIGKPLFGYKFKTGRPHGSTDHTYKLGQGGADNPTTTKTAGIRGLVV